MLFVEKKCDLFAMPEEYYLAHCISGDYALGAGIAKVFTTKMDMKFKLFKNFPIPIGQKYANVGKALLVERVFNLVTKGRCFEKPTYDSLWVTLCDMQKQCKELGITKLAMPKIGCGLDKLEWEEVKELIFEVFEDDDIEIVVCYLE